MKTPARKGGASRKRTATPGRPAAAARKPAAPAPAAGKPAAEATLRGYDPRWLTRLYRDMVLIREFEERVKFLFLKMPDQHHLAVQLQQKLLGMRWLRHSFSMNSLSADKNSAPCLPLMSR